MPEMRFFSPEELNEGAQIVLTGKEHHHLAGVMRAEMGKEVEVVNGRGALAIASVEQLKKRSATLQIRQIQEKKEPPPPKILALAIPRLNRLDTIVEKGTELGMTELWLFPGERSEKKSLSNNQLERLCTISIAALKQSGRLYLPKIQVKPPLNQWDAPTQHFFYGDLDPEAPRLHDQKIPLDQEKLIVIGPESGFTDEEINILVQMGAIGVNLHPNILRTDTAAISALLLLS